MAHQKLTLTKKTLFGLPIMKPDRPPIETQRSVAPRIRDTQRQLEKLEREALVKRARAKSKRIRSKTRLANSPFK